MSRKATRPAYSRDPHIIVGSAGVSRSNERIVRLFALCTPTNTTVAHIHPLPSPNPSFVRTLCEDRRSLSLPDSTRQDASPMFVRRHHHPREIGGRASLPLTRAHVGASHVGARRPLPPGNGDRTRARGAASAGTAEIHPHVFWGFSCFRVRLWGKGKHVHKQR